MATIPIITEIVRMVPGLTIIRKAVESTKNMDPEMTAMIMTFLLGMINIQSIQRDITNQKKGINSLAVLTKKIGEVIIYIMSIQVILMLVDTVANS